MKNSFKVVVMLDVDCQEIHRQVRRWMATLVFLVLLR